MAYTIEETKTFTKPVTIELTNDDIQKRVNRKLRALQKTAKIHGFRKGKVPMSVMKERYGGGAFREAVDDLMGEEMQKVGTELPNIIYYGRAELVPTESGLKSSFIVEVVPEIDPVGYIGLEISGPKVEVTDELIDERIKALQESYAIYQPVEGRDVVEVGDVVTIDFRPISKTVKDLDDSALTVDGLQIEITEDAERRWPLADALIGSSKSELDTVVMKLKDLGIQGYGEDESCTLEVTIKSIECKVLLDLDDDFALETKLADTYEGLREKVKEILEKNLEAQRLQDLRGEVARKLWETYDFELPPNFVQQEIEQSIRQQLAQVGFQDAWEPNLNLRQVLPGFDKSVEMMRPGVERDIRTRFVIDKIRQTNDDIPELTNEGVQEFLFRWATQNNIPPNDLRQRFISNEQDRNSLLRIAHFENVLTFLANNAEITEMPQEEFYKMVRQRREAENPTLQEEKDGDEKESTEESEESPSSDE